MCLAQKQIHIFFLNIPLYSFLSTLMPKHSIVTTVAHGIEFHHAMPWPLLSLGQSIGELGDRYPTPSKDHHITSTQTHTSIDSLASIGGNIIKWDRWVQTNRCVINLLRTEFSLCGGVCIDRLQSERKRQKEIDETCRLSALHWYEKGK